MTLKKTDNDIEKALNELEEIINELRNSELSVDDAVKLYEKGVKQCGVCEDILEEKRQKIAIYGEEEEKSDE